ncbi:unnamed protein product [Absidia cylindrospora]
MDPWLTQKSTLCPICKYNCLPTQDSGDDHTEPSSGGDPMGSNTTERDSNSNTTVPAESNNHPPCNEETTSNHTLQQQQQQQQQQHDATTRNDDRTSAPSLSTLLEKEKEIQAMHADRRPSSSSSSSLPANKVVEDTSATLKEPSLPTSPSPSDQHEIPSTTTMSTGETDEKRNDDR